MSWFTDLFKRKKKLNIEVDEVTDNGELNEQEKIWLNNCIVEYTTGSIPTRQELHKFSKEKQQFYYEFSLNLQKVKDAQQAFLNANYEMGAMLYDEIKPYFARSMQSMINIERMKAERRNKINA